MWYGVVYAPVDDEIDEHDGHAGVRQQIKRVCDVM